MSKSIRFIDSQYHDLFRIPDGGTIQVNYPDRSFAVKCEYVDDYHLRVANELFHICQLAEILERDGWDYTYFDKEMNELDGGQLDAPELSLQEARDVIAKDIGWSNRTMTQLDYEGFMEQASDRAMEKLPIAQPSVLQQLKELMQEAATVPHMSGKQLAER